MQIGGLVLGVAVREVDEDVEHACARSGMELATGESEEIGEVWCIVEVFRVWRTTGGFAHRGVIVGRLWVAESDLVETTGAGRERYRRETSSASEIVINAPVDLPLLAIR